MVKISTGQWLRKLSVKAMVNTIEEKYVEIVLGLNLFYLKCWFSSRTSIRAKNFFQTSSRQFQSLKKYIYHISHEILTKRNSWKQTA